MAQNLIQFLESKISSLDSKVTRYESNSRRSRLTKLYENEGESVRIE